MLMTQGWRRADDWIGGRVGGGKGGRQRAIARILGRRTIRTQRIVQMSEKNHISHSCSLTINCSIFRIENVFKTFLMCILSTSEFLT